MDELVRCPLCQALVNVGGASIGFPVTCAACRRLFAVPSPPPDSSKTRAAVVTCPSCGRRLRITFPENKQSDGELVCACGQRHRYSIRQKTDFITQEALPVPGESASSIPRETSGECVPAELAVPTSVSYRIASPSLPAGAAYGNAVNCYCCGCTIARGSPRFRRTVKTGDSSGMSFGRRSLRYSTRTYRGMRTVCTNCARQIDSSIGCLVLAAAISVAVAVSVGFGFCLN